MMAVTIKAKQNIFKNTTNNMYTFRLSIVCYR